MRHSIALILASLVLTTAGCGNSGADANGATDFQVLDAAANYAQSIRNGALSIRSALQERDGGLAGARAGTDSLLEALEGYESKEVAKPNKEVFDEISRLSKELKGLFESKTPLPSIQNKINELTAAAEKLPGSESGPVASVPRNNS